MKTVDVLIAAKELIKNEAKWSSIPRGCGPVMLPGRTTGVVYRNALGTPTRKRAEAECFCSIGAVAGAIGCDVDSEYDGLYSDTQWGPATKPQRRLFARAKRYLNAAATTLFRAGDIVTVNDNSSHADVMAVFDLAIKNAKRRHINGK